ncbi:MAG: phosphate acyltransferase PlsX [Planctomycetota bacterium]
MRFGIDAMGGDRAPAAEVEGALAACAELADDDRIVLVGNTSIIKKYLAGREDTEPRIEIVHAEQRIGMHESPVESLRAKPNSSLVVLTELHAADEVDACISAGNTGAFVGAAQMRLRRLRGVHRPGIAVLVPTLHGPVAVCDVGANVSCRSMHLYQYAIMASVYMESVCGVKNPRVAVLSVGEEDQKGNELVKVAHGLIKANSSVYFVGNVEGRDLFRGVCDVLVCDGFVGNVVIKLIEGMSEGLIRDILNNLKDLTTSSREMTHVAMEAAKKTLDKYDYNEYGGAPLLGVGGICLICHGASTSLGIKNAVMRARKFATDHVNERVTELLTEDERTCHG